MFEFKKICDAYESLTTVEKGLMITEKSVKILAKLNALDLDGIDPLSTLAGFIVDSVVADGKIDEQEYLLIYPSLIAVFGYQFDLAAVKQTFVGKTDVKRQLTAYLDGMLKLFSLLDEDLKADVIMLCLCVVAIDGKISYKEKKYIRNLCKA